MADPATESPRLFGARSPWRQRLRQVTCGLLLITSALVLWQTIAEARRRTSINAPIALSPFSDPNEKAQRLHDVVGTFTTGKLPGDRAIVITEDGHVRFTLIGPFSKALTVHDRFDVGRRDKELCLSTANSGPIDILDIDTLRFGEVAYERVPAEK